jgi:hypothetical protein
MHHFLADIEITLFKPLFVSQVLNHSALCGARSLMVERSFYSFLGKPLDPKYHVTDPLLGLLLSPITAPVQ